MVKNELSKGIDIELGEEMAEGQYANMVVIAHSTSEFVLDFVRIMPGLPKARVKSRIVLAPEHAKRLLLLAPRKHRPLRKLDRPDPDPQLVCRRNKTSHELPGRRGLTRRTVPERRKRTAAIRRRLRRPSRKKAMFRPRAVAKRLPGGFSSAAEIRRHINGTVST